MAETGTTARSKGVRQFAVTAGVVAGVAVVGVGIWPALASDGAPDLPEVTAEELLAQVAASDTAQLSGTVRVNTDLAIPGLPDLGGLVSGVLGDSGASGVAGAVADLAAGEASLRVAVDGAERQRLAVQDGDEEFAVIHNGDEVWAYDSASNTVFQLAVPEPTEEERRQLEEELENEWGAHGPFGGGEGIEGLTPQELAERFLDGAGEHADITVDGTARVAGRDAYQLLVEPRGEAAAELDGRASAVRVSVDGETGVPLAVTVEGEDGTLLDVSFSEITYEQPTGGTFDFTPPADATVHELNDMEELFGEFGGLLPEDMGAHGGW
ncbi:LolA family protein [Streptomyces sp. 4N509B]|uniref:LolA family protein n=1 Tax=Streptomyces sp. 4N509B TaxID=3457413 RepID=UPI003FD2DE6E